MSRALRLVEVTRMARCLTGTEIEARLEVAVSVVTVAETEEVDIRIEYHRPSYISMMIGKRISEAQKR